MGLSNYPPGVRESDIPGSRPEDVAYERWMERALVELDRLGVDEDSEHEEWLLNKLTERCDGEMSPEEAASIVAEEYDAHDFASEEEDK